MGSALLLEFQILGKLREHGINQVSKCLQRPPWVSVRSASPSRQTACLWSPSPACSPDRGEGSGPSTCHREHCCSPPVDEIMDHMPTDKFINLTIVMCSIVIINYFEAKFLLLSIVKTNTDYRDYGHLWIDAYTLVVSSIYHKRRNLSYDQQVLAREIFVYQISCYFQSLSDKNVS